MEPSGTYIRRTEISVYLNDQLLGSETRNAIDTGDIEQADDWPLQYDPDTI